MYDGIGAAINSKSDVLWGFFAMSYPRLTLRAVCGPQNAINLACHLAVHTQLSMLIADRDIAKNPHKTSLFELIAAPIPSYIF
jgi:hypothetical protein